MSEFVPVSLLCRPVAFALVCTALLAGSHDHAHARAGETIGGRALVIDGDTLEINGQRVRLEGIDAPEMAQTCGRRWFGSWSCGAEATRMLTSRVDGRHVECAAQGLDKYGRVLGLCTVDNRDINSEMVRSGYAWAFVKYSNRYVAEESYARAEKLGIWQGKAEPAWEYRANRWANAEPVAPNGCAIKGNVTEHGHIYHMPWSPWYGKVKVETAKGEAWFCSESEASNAGFRPAMQH